MHPLARRAHLPRTSSQPSARATVRLASRSRSDPQARTYPTINFGIPFPRTKHTQSKLNALFWTACSTLTAPAISRKSFQKEHNHTNAVLLAAMLTVMLDLTLAIESSISGSGGRHGHLVCQEPGGGDVKVMDSCKWVELCAPFLQHSNTTCWTITRQKHTHIKKDPHLRLHLDAVKVYLAYTMYWPSPRRTHRLPQSPLICSLSRAN
jgi:hypothetical protein